MALGGLAGLLVNLAKGILWVLRISLAVVSFVIGLCSCIVPWRIPSLSQYSEADDLNDFTLIGFGLMGVSILDIFVSILFVITLFTWRMPRMLRKMRMEFDYPGKFIRWKNRENIAECFGRFMVDIPFVIMGILTHITFWRIIKLWGKIRDDPRDWRKNIWKTFQIAVTDIPSAIVAVCLLLVPWRIRKAIRLTKKQPDDDYAWKKNVFIQFGKGVTELILVPFMIPVILTGYRLKTTWELLKKLQDTDEELSDARCDIKLEIMREGSMVFVDFFLLILTVLTSLMVVRISSLVALFRKRPEDIRMRILIDFLLSFRELLGVLAYVIMLPFFYRFWFAFSSARQASRSSADPRPHAVVSTMTVEYPEEGGIKIHLAGSKLAGVQFKTAKLFIRENEFWEALGGMAVVAKTFLPLKLTTDVLNPEDFSVSGDDFTTTLHFKVAKEKVYRKQIRETVGTSTRIRIAVEFDEGSGTLFDISFLMGQLLETGTPIDFQQPTELFETSMTSDALRADAKKVPGQLFCDAMSMPAFVQFGLLLVDIVALLLFVGLHLIPTRVYTLYRRILLGSSEAITRDKFIAARNSLSKILQRRHLAMGSAFQAIDESAKECSLNCFRFAKLDPSARSYRSWCRWWSTYNSGSDSPHFNDVKYFINQINKSSNVIANLQLDEAKELTTALNAFMDATSTAAFSYAGSVCEHYRLTHANKLTFSGSSVTTIQAVHPVLHLFPSANPPVVDIVKKGTQLVLKKKSTQFTCQHAYAEFQNDMEDAEKAYAALLKELDKPMSAGSLSCKRFSPPAVKSEVFRTTKEFGMDVAAALAALFVACTVYRLPVLVKALYRCRAGEVRKTIYTNLAEIPIDFLYLLKAIVVIAFLRNAVPMITDVIQQATQKRTFKAVRKVVDHYLMLTAYDIHLLLGFVLCWNTIVWGMGCAVFGFLLPGVMFTWVLFGKPGEGCCETFSVLIGTGWFYGFPIVAGVTLLSEGYQTSVFTAIFGVLGLFLLIFTISWMRTTDTKELVLVHGIFLRWNWFNGLQFAYTAVECIQVVGLLVLAHLKDNSTDLSDWVYDFFRASLVYYPEEGTMSVTIALVLAMVFYFVAAVPVTALAVESNAEIITHNGWVFLMELLSQGCLPLIIFQLTDYVMCEPAEFCWSGEHRRLGTFTLLVLVFYIIASYAKPPEYTTSHCKLLDCVFVEGYSQVAKYSLMAVIIATVALRDNTSMVFVAVTIHCVWTLFWTIAYPRVFGISRVCSSDFYTWYKIIGYSAVLIVSSLIQHGLPGVAASGGFVVVLLAVSYKFGFSHDDDMRQSPEQIQQGLLELYEDLANANCLAKSFVKSQNWKKSVKGCIRVSQLASLIVQLEEAILYQHLDPIFLTTRPTWKNSLSSYIETEDVRRFIDDFDDYYHYYWWDPCLHFFLGFLCCARSMSGFSGGTSADSNMNTDVANTPEAFADLNTKFQQLKNGVQLVILPEDRVRNETLPSSSEGDDDDDDDDDDDGDEKEKGIGSCQYSEPDPEQVAPRSPQSLPRSELSFVPDTHWNNTADVQEEPQADVAIEIGSRTASMTTPTI